MKEIGKEKGKIPMKWMFFAPAQFQIGRISDFDSNIVKSKIPTVFGMIDNESDSDEDDDEEHGISCAIKVIPALKTGERSVQSVINKRKTYKSSYFFRLRFVMQLR